MKRTVIIDLAQNLVQIGSVTKRLPLQIKIDHQFAILTWDGAGARGSITYASGQQIPFTDERIVAPFVEMFDIEPPQVFPERIGAGPQMGPEDQEWVALKARHAAATLQIAAFVEATVGTIADEVAAKQAAADAEQAAFQRQMNERRKALGRPEIDYAAR